MTKRLVAISGCFPCFRPIVSRALRDHETFPKREGDFFYLEDLGEDVYIFAVTDDRVEIILSNETVERLRDRFEWHEDEPKKVAA